MGGITSAILGPPEEIWTPEERAQNEASLLLQRAAADFVVKYLFVDVPVKVNKLSMDPASPLWIQIDQSKVQELNDLVAQQASSGGGRYVAVDDRIFNSVPTGVMVNKLGAIQIIFEKESTGKLVYELSVKDAQIAEMRVAGPPAPKQPSVSEVGKRGMRLDWTFPAPPGVVQAAEIVHATVPKDYKGSSSSKSAVDYSAGLTWKVFAKKKWEFLHFQDEVMGDMLPGTTHVFRMRYRDISGWSDYSAVTEPVTTLPDVPATPKGMKCGGCFPDAVSLQWRVPVSNGSPITAFIVHGRSVGDDFVEIYRGLTTSYLAVGLHPEFAYSFTLTAVNDVGNSLPSQMLSLQLPPRKTERGMTFLDEELKRVADKTKEAWREFWDQKTGKSFYFNSITGQRTLDRPECMGAMLDFAPPESAEGERQGQGEGETNEEAGESASSSPSKASAHRRHQRHGRHSHSSAGGGGEEASSPDSPSKAGADGEEAFLVDLVKAKEMAFRTKRFKLLQAIHKDKKQRGSITSPVTRHNTTSPGLTTAVAAAGGAAGAEPGSPGVTVLRNALEVSIRRDRLLSDGYHQLMSASMDALMKRTRISFVGEEGIDSGGPSKEFFLLLSAQAGVFGSSKRTFLRTADEGGLFLNGPIPPPKPIPADNVGLGSTPTTTPKPHGKSPPDMNDLQISIFDYASFLGRLLGKALFERQLVDLPMAHALLDAILGHQNELHADEEDDENEDEEVVNSFSSSPSKAPNTTSTRESAKAAKMTKSGKYMNEMHRLGRLDVQLHKSLSWILDNDIEDIIVQTFSVTSLIYPPGGGPPKPKDFPLCKNGLTKDVTDKNKEEYVRLRAEYETRYAAEKTLRPFTDAFHELVPLHALKEAAITPIELDIMLNGKTDIDVEEVRAYTIFQGNLSCEHIQVVWLWDILRQWDLEQRRAFLRFVTGTSRVALDGYDPPFNLTEGSDMVVGSLPRAHTCFNQLVLPEYKSREQMSERMWFAIENTDGFAMA